MGAKEASIMLIIMMFVINIGLIALEASDTGLQLFSVSDGFNLDTLEETYKALTPPEATENTCSDAEQGILCLMSRTVTTFSDAGNYTVFLISSIFVYIKFLLSNLHLVIFGWQAVLANLANLIEGDITGPVHILFGSFSAIIFLIIIFGIWEFLREGRLF